MWSVFLRPSPSITTFGMLQRWKRWKSISATLMRGLEPLIGPSEAAKLHTRSSVEVLHPCCRLLALSIVSAQQVVKDGQYLLHDEGRCVERGSAGKTEAKKKFGGLFLGPKLEKFRVVNFRKPSLRISPYFQMFKNRKNFGRGVPLCKCTKKSFANF